MSGKPDIFRNLGKPFGVDDLLAPEESPPPLDDKYYRPRQSGESWDTKVESAGKPNSSAPNESPEPEYQLELPGSPPKVNKESGRSLF